MLGRPSSIPRPAGEIPVFEEQKALHAMLKLSRVVDKVVENLYSSKHSSLLPMWKAANEIRQDLHEFERQQAKDMDFELTGDPKDGEMGICQMILSNSELII